MADEVSIDKNAFHNRLHALITAWKSDKRSGNSMFNDASSLAIVVGKNDEVAGFHKANALQYWLLGYEFPTTLFVITQEGFYAVTTKKKAVYLEGLKDGKTPVEILVRSKDADENKKQFEKLLDIIKNAGNKLGVLTKDVATGPFVAEWKSALSEISKDVSEVDISQGLSTAMAVKDENELRMIRDAAHATAYLMSDYFVDTMSGILDEDQKITHKALSDKVTNKIDDEKFFRKMKASDRFDPLQLEWSINPTVMSGVNYDLRLATEPDDNNLHAGVIVCAFGLRYMTYASMIARTYLVDPNKHQESTYKLLLTVHEAVISELRDGVQAKDVYNKAIALIKSSKKPELAEKFVRNVGAAIGIEPRDSSLILNGKNTRVLKDGMTFAVTTGFQDVENPEPQDKKRDAKYSMMLSDTVRIHNARVNRGQPINFTTSAASTLEDTSFFFNESDEEEKKPTKAKRDSRIGAVAQSNITKTRLRAQGGTTANEEKEAARRDHQKELHQKKHNDGLDKYKEGTGNLNGTEEKRFKRFESYKRDSQFPTRVKDLAIITDERNDTVVLPIMGRPVPFHINTIKNASTTTESKFCFLRINFLSPGQGVGRKDDQPFEDPSAQFIRSLTFRSSDAPHLRDIADRITDMKKAAVRREQEKKEQEGVAEQDKLVEVRDRRPHRLENIYMRPSLESKRIGGLVEIHRNGLRYLHQGGTKVDITFSNIKHLFFQPCVSELIVIIHIHLIDPLLIGKRKTKDVQFYREATEMQFDETTNRKRKHRYGDEEEFEAEQEEKRRRAQLDKEFRNFAEKIAEAGKNDGLSVDMPFRDLGFNGVPSRSSVIVQPTTDCLVQLTEPPFLVITLTDIEVVHLERVQYGLKNFDMVIVYKDFTRPPTHINTIPVESLDAVKDWLDSVDIPFSEGPLNLNWATIMKTLIADPHAFFAEGGWSFLNTESDSEDGDESEEESAFEVSEDELVSDESSEEESDFDDDASADASDEEVSEEDEGEDWDEMEKKAKKKDRESNLDDDEDKGRRKKR